MPAKKLTKAQKIKRLKNMKPGLYRNMALKRLGAGKTKPGTTSGTKPSKATFAKASKTSKTNKSKARASTSSRSKK
jgi:hypothetical protein